MGWFSRRHKTDRADDTAALEPLPDASRSYRPVPETGAGPPWQGRGLRLPAAPTPANAAELAERAADAALQVSGVNLDYSPASLHHVDAILAGFREPGSDIMAESIFVFGCYIGEVMVRNAGYEWVDTPDDLARHLGRLTVYHPGKESHANPISKAFKRVDYGDLDNVPHFYRVFTREDPLLD